MRRTVIVLMVVTSIAAAAFLAGCGSKAPQYAQEARSSYINARAVLVGVQEFPAQMEELIRSEDLDALDAEADELIDYTRDLLNEATSAFRTVSEKCELLKGENSEKYNPYADRLLELAGLNEQVVNFYSEFIGVSNSVIEGLAYRQNPGDLMPSLDRLDALTMGIQELSDQIRQLEEEAEALYREITS